MKFMEKDRDVLAFLIRHGWATAHLLVEAGFWGYSANAYRRLKQLRNEELVKLWSKWQSRPGAFAITSQGKKMIETDLSVPSEPKLHRWDHDLSVSYILLRLSKSKELSEIERVLTE